MQYRIERDKQRGGISIFALFYCFPSRQQSCVALHPHVSFFSSFLLPSLCFTRCFCIVYLLPLSFCTSLKNSCIFSSTPLSSSIILMVVPFSILYEPFSLALPLLSIHASPLPPSLLSSPLCLLILTNTPTSSRTDKMSR